MANDTVAEAPSGAIFSQGRAMKKTQKSSSLSALFGHSGPECGYRGEGRLTKRLAFCYHLLVTKLAAAISRQRFPERDAERIAHGFRVIYHFPYDEVVVAERVSPAGSSGDSWQSGDCFSAAAGLVSRLCFLGDESVAKDVYSTLARMDEASARQALVFVRILRRRQFRVLRDGADFSLLNCLQSTDEATTVPNWLKPLSRADARDPLTDT